MRSASRRSRTRRTPPRRRARRRSPAEQRRARHVETVPARRGSAGRSRRASSDHCDPDRDVDEEHQPPAHVRPAEGDQPATDQRAQRGADPHRRAEDAERPAPLIAAEQLLHQAGHLRVDQPTGQPLQHPRAR